MRRGADLRAGVARYETTNGVARRQTSASIAATLAVTTRSPLTGGAAVTIFAALCAAGCGNQSFGDAAMDITRPDTGVDVALDVEDATVDADSGPLNPVTVVAHRTAMPQAMASNVVLERPAEAMAGDLLIAIVVFDEHEPMLGMIVTPDAGWSLLRAEHHGAIFTRRASAMDPMSFTFRRPMDAGGTATWGGLLALRGTRPMPIDDVTSQFQPTDWCRQQIPIASGVTSRSTGALLMWVGFARDSSGSCGDAASMPNQGIIPPPDMAELFEVRGRGGMLSLATQLLVNGGPTGTRVGRVDGPASPSYVSFLFAMSPQ